MKPLAPDWDARWMQALEEDRLEDLLGLSEDAITQEAGLSAHESKTWLIARAAMPRCVTLQCAARYYRAIPEFIAGFGALLLVAPEFEDRGVKRPIETAFDRIIGPGRSPSTAATLLGWRLIAVDQTAATIEVSFEPQPEFANPIGTVQGGMLAAMLDESMGPVSLTRLAPDEFAPTIEFKVGFVRAAPMRRITGKARVVNAGRSLLFLEGELYDDQGRLVATATATAMRVAAAK